MPFLCSADALPARPRRVAVAGTSGSGKTTLVGRIASVLGASPHELDALSHGPGWTRRPSFVDDVRAFLDDEAWVCEYQYTVARPLVGAKADLLVWLDPPVAVVMTQVIRRTVTRRIDRRELWNGNVEPPLREFFTDRDHIVRRAWRTRGKARRQVHELAAERPELPVVRLGSHREAADWLAGPLRASAADG